MVAYPFAVVELQKGFVTSSKILVSGIVRAIQSVIHRKSFQLPLREKAELEALEARVLLSADLTLSRKIFSTLFLWIWLPRKIPIVFDHTLFKNTSLK